MTNIKIRCVRGEEGLASIKQDWLQLTNLIGDVGLYQTYQYYQSFIKAFVKDDSLLYFFLFYENKRLIGIFPLEKRKLKCFGISIPAFEIPGNYNTSLSDVVINSNKPLLGIFLQYTNQYKYSWHIIKAKFILEHSHLIRLLYKSESIPSLRIFQHMNDFLTKDLIDNVRKKSQKRSRSVHRKIKLLEQLGKLEFLVAKNLEELKINYKEFLDVEASGWKGRSETAIKHNPEAGVYFSQLLDHFSSLNSCRIYVLKLDGQTIAAQFCLIVNKTCYYMKIGYDERYSRMSPGIILIEKALTQLSTENIINQYNFMTHHDYYKQWRPKSANKYEVYIFNKTFLGQLGRLWFHCKKIIYKIIY